MKNSILPSENILCKEYYGLSVQKIPLSVTKVTSRVFHYLRNNDLLEYPLRDKGEKRERVKLNYFEAFWLMIVKELRIYGTSDKNLRTIKDFLHTSILNLATKGLIPNDYSMDYIRILGLIKAEKKSTPSFTNTVDYSHLRSLFIGDDEQMYYSNLGLVLNLLLVSKDKPYLVVSTNQNEEEGSDVDVQIVSQKQGNNVVDSILNHTGASQIVVNFHSIYLQLFDLEIDDEILLNYHLISPREKKILDEVRGGDFKELIIKRDGEDIKCKVKKDGQIQGEDVRTLRRILGSNDYKNVSLKYRNDKFVYFERESDL